MCQDILGGFEMKNKYKIISKISCEKWINASNLLAKSLIEHNEALRQFNALSASKRVDIKNALQEYDSIRRKKIPANDVDNAWEISVMVDAHIIATENNIDPLTVIMCINAPCKANEHLVPK